MSRVWLIHTKPSSTELLMLSRMRERTNGAIRRCFEKHPGFISPKVRRWRFGGGSLGFRPSNDRPSFWQSDPPDYIE